MMETAILFVVILALGWHLSIIWLERSCKSHQGKRPLERLLRSAELDILSILRAELSKLARVEGNHRGYYRSKLNEVNSLLRRFGNVDDEERSA